nr:probable calcium-binding protein CML15 [Ipomoea batatas]
MGAIMKVFGVFTRPPSAQASVGAEKKHDLARFLGSPLRRGVRIWRRFKTTEPLILPPDWVIATPARPSWSPGDRVSHIKLIVVFTWMPFSIASQARLPVKLSVMSCWAVDGGVAARIAAHTSTKRLDQLNQLREIFARFDMDADGSLTHLELAALLRSLGIRPSGDQVYVMLNNMDVNGNGSIEFEELVNAIMPDITAEILGNQEKLLEVFNSFDRDGNGFITLPELAGSMAKMGQALTYNQLKAMLEEADTDGDGAINFTEFTAIMAKSASEFLGLPLPPAVTQTENADKPATPKLPGGL